MKPSREMNREILERNLQEVLKEFHFSGTPFFRIIPVYNPEKTEEGFDSVFRLVVLNDENIGGKTFSMGDAVDVLSCLAPLAPTQITIKLCSDSNETAVFELHTSTRLRKPSLLANIETGHPPFKAIEG